MMAMKPIPGEVGWGDGAIGNARWVGVSLREVLEKAEPEPDARHAAFTGLDEIVKGDRSFGFGGSIPLSKAMGNDVLLAYEMNGEPLPPVHGFPLRAVVPGYIGARSVKWLSQVTLQIEPSQNYYQAQAYKLFPADVTIETADWTRGLMLGEFHVNSVICEPSAGAKLSSGPVTVRGYSVAGGNRTVERVDVSPDGGSTWIEAELTGENQPGAWRFWETQLDLNPGDCDIIARAWDSAAHTQPEDIRQIWNFKGYFNNAWHRVHVSVRLQR
jgi:sulfite oxidase